MEGLSERHPVFYRRLTRDQGFSQVDSRPAGASPGLH
jgi:hypothetical protein